MSFLDSNGVSRLWQNIIAKLSGYVAIEEGKGLSSNDYTNEEKAELNELAQHPKLPVATAEDAGKFLQVNANGEWEMMSVPNAEEMQF